MKVYDCRVPTGSVVNVFQSLRYIERGLKSAEPANTSATMGVSSHLSGNDSRIVLPKPFNERSSELNREAAENPNKSKRNRPKAGGQAE